MARRVSGKPAAPSAKGGGRRPAARPRPDTRGAAPADAAALAASDRAAGIATAITGLLVSGFLLWRNRQWMDFSEYNLLNTACILWLPLLVVLLGLRRDPADFGLAPGDVKRGTVAAFALFLLFVPVILFFAPTPGPQEYYLDWMTGSRTLSGAFPAVRGSGKIDWARLVYHEAVMGFYMFGWEWYHRGFLLFGLKRIMPVWGAVVAQAVLFMALHWGKPPAEVASSLPGGILMALVALRYRSFLPCFLLHWLVSAGFDGAVLYYHFRR